MKNILAFLYGVPYRINNHCPYCTDNEPYRKLEKKGFVTGKVSRSVTVGTRISMLQKDGHDFIYIITDIRRLKGSDFLAGTEYEYDLQFFAKVKSTQL